MVGDRFEVVTWPFGSIHQSKVFVTTPGSKSERVGVCLPPGKTRKEAMQRGLDWVAAYKAPDSPDELFPKLFRQWRTIYRTRVDIIDHLFFVIGNGYSWLDGAIVPTSDYPEEPSVPAPPDGSPEVYSDAFFDLSRSEQRVIQEYHYYLREQATPIGPLPDDGAPRNFYPVCHYSAILNIPANVRPEWLLVAYEAALLLRDRQTTVPSYTMDRARCEENIAYGKRVVDELEAKYPHLKGSVIIKVAPPSETPTDSDADDLVEVSGDDVKRVRAMVAEVMKRKTL
jgi:hypothetical protein